MKLGDVLYALFLLCVGIFLVLDATRAIFVQATNSFPVVMGFLKFFILATSGELLSRRITSGRWQFRGIRLLSRAVIWGIIGIMVTYIFKIFGTGINVLVDANMLPVFPKSLWEGVLNTICRSFWMSLFTNLFFGFEMMIFHRLTDTLIDEGRLLQNQNIVETWRNINWDSIFKFVFPSLFRFWLPMHTITFSLPAEFQVLMASLLGIALGIILSFARSRDSK